MQCFILTTRGLEHLAAAEVRQHIPEARILSDAYRRIIVDVPETQIARLLGLRCADDVFLLLSQWSPLNRDRRSLDSIYVWSRQLDLFSAREVVARTRSLKRRTCFAISVSFVGKRNYSTPEMKLAMAEGIAERFGWAYLEDEDPEAISLRLFIEHEDALVGLRLGSHPLHRRPYRLNSVPGSLKSPVAAAMAQLAGATSGMRLLDPMCGAGTILVEAAQMGAEVIGGDLDPAAISVCNGNLAAANLACDVWTWDVRSLPLEADSIDGVACNLPFGMQVTPGADLRALYRDALGEFARVLRPHKRAALLSGRHDLLHDAITAAGCWQVRDEYEISLHGVNPKIIVIELA